MRNYFMSCPLCNARIAEQYRVVCENAHVFVLVNREPVKDGHVLILPVRHVGQLSDLDPRESIEFLRMIDRCMAAVQEAYVQTPMCLVNGSAFRTQPHLHAHVLPSLKPLRGLYAAAEGLAERQEASPETLAAIAEKIKSFLS